MEPLSPPSPWQWLWRYVLAAAVIAGLGLRYYAQDHPVAVIDVILLAFHESSHWATIWAPRSAYFLAGSVGQVLIPLAIGAYLHRVQGDRLGGAVGLAWAGLSMHGVARYIADAPSEQLPLVGGDTHDWAYLLGPERWDLLDRAADIARGVTLTGEAMVAAAVFVCLAVPFLNARGILDEPGPAAAPELPPMLGAPPAALSAPAPADDLPPVFPHPLAPPEPRRLLAPEPVPAPAPPGASPRPRAW